MAPLTMIELIRKNSFSRAELDFLPKPEPLIKGFLNKRAYAMIYGYRGCKKTFVAISIALSVVTGKAFMNHEVPRFGRVLYILSEGRDGIRIRIRGWERYHGIKIPNDRFTLTSMAFDFVGEKDAIELINAFEDQHFDLIVVDTLAKNFGRGNENETRDGNMFNMSMERLRDYFNAAILVIHHSSDPKKPRSRGTTAIEAAMDQVYLLSSAVNNSYLKDKKNKDSETQKNILLNYQKMNLGNDENTIVPVLRVGSAVESIKDKQIKLGKNQQMFVNIAKEMSSNGNSNFDLKSFRVACNQASIERGIPEKSAKASFRRTLDGLIEQNILKLNSAQTRLTYNNHTPL